MREDFVESLSPRARWTDLSQNKKISESRNCLCNHHSLAGFYMEIVGSHFAKTKANEPRRFQI